MTDRRSDPEIDAFPRSLHSLKAPKKMSRRSRFLESNWSLGIFDFFVVDIVGFESVRLLLSEELVVVQVKETRERQSLSMSKTSKAFLC